MKRNRIWIGGLTLMLAVSLLVSCNLMPLPLLPKDPVTPADTLWDNAWLKTLRYSLPESDAQVLRERIAECEQLCRTGRASDARRMEDALWELKWTLDYIERQRDVAKLLHDYDLSDAEAQKARRESTAVYEELFDEYWNALHRMQTARRPLSSVVSAFVEEMHPERHVVVYDGDEYYLQMEELTLQYDTYNFQGTAEEIYDIYTQYLSASRKYAGAYGYENYYEFKHAVSYDRDYGQEEREQLRTYVKQYLVPLYHKYEARANALYAALPIWDQIRADSYASSPFDRVAEQELFDYFDSLPESATVAMRQAFELGHIVVGDKENSLDTAYAYFVGSLPYCYFSEDDLDLVAVSHELGHYYANFHHGDNRKNWSYDLRETHSQTSSLLMLSYLREQLDSVAFDAYAADEIRYMIYMAILSAIRDEFDETVFSDPNAPSYTAEQLDAIMGGLIEEYGVEDISRMKRSLSTYWHGYGMDSPAYHISYTASFVVAFQLYQISLTDYEAATYAYRDLVECIDDDSSFLGTVEAAGLLTPLDEDVYLTYMK